MLTKLGIMLIFLMLSTFQLEATVLNIVKLDMSTEKDLQQIIGRKLTICSASSTVRVEFKPDHRVLYTKHPRYGLGTFDLGPDNSTRLETEWFVVGKKICEKEIDAQNGKAINCKNISRGNRIDYFFVEQIEQGSTNFYTMQECIDPNFDCSCGDYNTF
ncbi:hypothetical protein GFK91_07550 [Roseibium aggregatum]|uniref:hypothetical protein n=1 Tax=Roseibium aggregatum TaxID=187304 RepID=UPI001E576FCE|nr:hypothetical protein [Roseibium aggregatum]UES55475.1 hypothetical protein GFK91_07550 [Roseibium aggregatum]